MADKKNTDDRPRRVVVYMPSKLSNDLARACRDDGQSVSSWARIEAEKKVRGQK